MWGSFCLALLASLALLFVPGYFILRGLGFARLDSALAAPLPSVLLSALLAIVFYKCGLFCTWWLLALACIVVSVAVYLAGRRFAAGSSVACVSTGQAVDSRAGGLAALSRFASSPWCVLLYLVAAILVYCYMFVLNVDDASSCVQYYDNMHHLGSIQSSLISGNWSSLDTTSYPDQIAGGVAPVASRFGFYPSAWHCIASFAASLTSCEVEVAENASIAAFCVFVFPMGMYLLLRKLFADKPMAVIAGCVCVVAFAFYPWRFMTFGPLFPNLASLSMLPAAAFSLLCIFDEGITRGRRASCAVLFVIGLGALVLTQPNVVFSLGVFVAPYLVVLASRIPLRLPCPRGGAWRVLAGVAAALCIVAAWVACNKAPFMQGVVSYVWDPYVPTTTAIKDVLSMRFLYHPAQLALSLLVLCGIIAAIVDRARLWLAVPFLLASCFYVVAASMEGPIRHLLTGFWYTDPNRIIAMVVIFAMPLAAWGFSAVIEALAAIFARLRGFGSSQVALGWYAAPLACLVLAFSVWNFWPNYYLTGQKDTQNAFDMAGCYMREAFCDQYNSWYDHSEREFVSEAVSIVGTDQVIANIPGDGSASAYGISGASVLYRYYDESRSKSELDASKQVREHMSEIATSPEVADAARELNVGYVLKLHRGGDGGVVHSGIDEWRGLISVEDDTPGFEVVLADGDMRLYRITAAA